MSEKLPAVARLYYTGSAHRRYKRASTRPGPGEPLCFVSVAEEFLRREQTKNRLLAEAAAKLLCEPGNPDYRDRLREELAKWMLESDSTIKSDF